MKKPVAAADKRRYVVGAYVHPARAGSLQSAAAHPPNPPAGTFLATGKSFSLHVFYDESVVRLRNCWSILGVSIPPDRRFGKQSLGGLAVTSGACCSLCKMMYLLPVCGGVNMMTPPQGRKKKKKVGGCSGAVGFG